MILNDLTNILDSKSFTRWTNENPGVFRMFRGSPEGFVGVVEIIDQDRMDRERWITFDEFAKNIVYETDRIKLSYECDECLGSPFVESAIVLIVGKVTKRREVGRAESLFRKIDVDETEGVKGR